MAHLALVDDAAFVTQQVFDRVFDGQDVPVVLELR